MDHTHQTKTDVTKSVNKNNADHAILFEAVNLIISQGDQAGTVLLYSMMFYMHDDSWYSICRRRWLSTILHTGMPFHTAIPRPQAPHPVHCAPRPFHLCTPA